MSYLSGHIYSHDEWDRRKFIETEKESPEKMIRSLQGEFCKGRYSSWVFEELRGKKRKKGKDNSKRNTPQKIKNE